MQMQCFISSAAQPQPRPTLKALRASRSPWGGGSGGGELLGGGCLRGAVPGAPLPLTGIHRGAPTRQPPLPPPQRLTVTVTTTRERGGCGGEAKAPSPALGSVYPFRAAEAPKLPTAESARNAVPTDPRRGTGVLQAALDLIKKIKDTFRAVSPI